MHLPFGRPLSFDDYPFVQPARGTRESIPRFIGGDVVSHGPLPPVEDLSAVASSTFDPDYLHPRIRAFFETVSGRMTMEWLRWEPWALGLAAPYVPAAARLGNLCVPDRVLEPRPVHCSVRTLRWADGTTSREWIRTFSATSELFYAAAVRPWTNGDATYLSMAFPYGPLHLMVLLRLHHRGRSLQISTRGDALAGTYTIVPRRDRFIALPGPPTDEVLSYDLADDGLAVLHEDFLGSRRTFAMRYHVGQA